MVRNRRTIVMVNGYFSNSMIGRVTARGFNVYNRVHLSLSKKFVMQEYEKTSTEIQWFSTPYLTGYRKIR